ncbi:MAG: patatin-like phospholipase family protein [Piscirickettsiaceae bacterium]|nr:patatin-like phospholipase family protein [Piscirickettsiaceae bacterium]
MLRLSLAIVLPLLLLVTPSSAVFAVELQTDRPKIGLALSGGGARGAAHVGVLKVLEELKIPVDYIAGTSMGAVVGGLYASGMSSDEIAYQLEVIDWETVFNDKPDRPDRSQRRKADDILYLVKGKVGVSESGLRAPTAVVQGQRFDLILKSLTLPVANINNFDDFPIPFRAVAMDIATGDEVILAEGDLSIAMHASMAIPAAFSPIELNGKLLVDGGAANNLPISVVRAMGADIVIAIDISTPLLTKDKLDRPLAVLDQLTGLLTRRNVEMQLQTLTEQDVLILPELDAIGTMDFSHVVSAIEQGRKAALMQQTELAALSLDAKKYEQYATSQSKLTWQQSVIDFIRFENDSQLSEEFLLHHLGINVGQNFDISDIETGISTIYGLDIFESVRYDLLTEKGETGLVVTAKQKSWGTDSLQAGLELSSDFSGESSFNIGFAYTQQPLNALNGEWRTALQLGEEPAIVTELYQPLDVAARYFIHTALSWDNRDIRLYGDVSGRADAEYEIQRWGLRLAAGRNFGNWGEIRVGVRRFTGNADLSVGAPSFRSFDFDDGNVFLRASIDTLDSLNFPREGYFHNIELTSAKDALGADTEYDKLDIQLSGAKSWNDDSLIFSLRYGSTLSGDSSIHNRYRLGGFMQLSGFNENELTGQHYGLLSLVYQRRLYRSQIIPVYAGLAAQFGNTWENKDDIGFGTDDLLSSGTLFLGTDTPIGPLYLGYGKAEGRDNGAAYLYLGQPFF